MEKTLQKIQEANPKLSSNSVKAYGSSLRQIQKSMEVENLTVPLFKKPRRFLMLSKNQSQVTTHIKTSLPQSYHFLRHKAHQLK